MSERSSCPDSLDQENIQEEMPRDVPDCLPSVLATQTGTPTNNCQQSSTSSLLTAMNMSGSDPCASNAPPPTSSPSPAGIPPAGVIKGRPSSYVAGVLEWTFTESQSNIQGRTGSNACAFIALIMGKIWIRGSLLWPRGDCLPESWRKSLVEAMIKGNKIHDDLFDHQAVDLEVEDAVSLADNECGVQRVGQQIDIYGINPVNQLANVLIQEAQNNTSKSCYVIMTEHRAMLLAVNPDSSAMIIDSHSHGTDGAIIACSQPGCIHLLAQWLDAMMNYNWQCSLTIASLTKVFYF